MAKSFKTGLTADGTVSATSLEVTGEFTLPTADGSLDQVLVTNGSGTVTWQDQSGGTTIPAGTVVMYGGGTAPSGWLVCDGSAVSRTTYSSLFTAISTRYGTGDGSTTFNLPGTSALVPVGIAASGNADGTTVSGSSALNALALGDQSADHAHTITSNAGNQSADHSHTITSNAGNQSANHNHTITSNAGNQSANHNHALTSATVSTTINVEPFLFIIKT